MRVLGDGRELPFTVQDRTLRFFSGVPDRVRVITEAASRCIRCRFRSSARQAGSRRQCAAWSAWLVQHSAQPRHLATPRDAGCGGLIAEWLLYGKGRRAETHQRVALQPEPSALEEGIMTFDRAWVLLFLLLPAVFACGNGVAAAAGST